MPVSPQMMGPCPSDTAEACSAPPPFSLGGFFRASGERSAPSRFADLSPARLGGLAPKPPWSASCCPVRTKMGLTAISIGLRWVNFHPFRGADRWAGTVASFLEISITVFDGGTLRLVRPWPMAGVRSFPSVVLPPFGVGAARGARVVLFLVRAGRYAVRMPL
ncbi:hypothetical protein PAPYR_9974 [Paratrimastix pyriformis]|uniref:Uncharacterized protein n=1 Tax=Paratrimastix pyriformis TaxID=342808 RepID=A0ABQ8U703_9EUKA|nr:hypothetical protein PAPYR_9974 [Paratrimastix pyriformis]